MSTWCVITDTRNYFKDLLQFKIFVACDLVARISAANPEIPGLIPGATRFSESTHPLWK
jgi:hypothetical protein